jgi:hypothetical protein
VGFSNPCHPNKKTKIRKKWLWHTVWTTRNIRKTSCATKNLNFIFLQEWSSWSSGRRWNCALHVVQCENAKPSCINRSSNLLILHRLHVTSVEITSANIVIPPCSTLWNYVFDLIIDKCCYLWTCFVVNCCIQSLSPWKRQIVTFCHWSLAGGGKERYMGTVNPKPSSLKDERNIMPLGLWTGKRIPWKP